jgi:hypothetical protein
MITVAGYDTQPAASRSRNSAVAQRDGAGRGRSERPIRRPLPLAADHGTQYHTDDIEYQNVAKPSAGVVRR